MKNTGSAADPGVQLVEGGFPYCRFRVPPVRGGVPCSRSRGPPGPAPCPQLNNSLDPEIFEARSLGCNGSRGPTGTSVGSVPFPPPHPAPQSPSSPKPSIRAKRLGGKMFKSDLENRRANPNPARYSQQTHCWPPSPPNQKATHQFCPGAESTLGS